MCADYKSRGTWASQLGFILAAAGSAVGLGNIWRFPYVAGVNGGAIFVLIYVMSVIFIAFPVMVAEILIGRTTKRNPVGAFKTLSPRKQWFLVGGLGVLTGLGILSYYSVVAGWTVGYLLMTIAGKFQAITTPADTGKIFSSYVSSPLWSIAGLGVFLLMTLLVVIGGVEKGIERVSKIFMPILFILLLILVIRAITLPGSFPGISFYLKPDFSEVTPRTFLSASGQSFFSLSLGMGAMITYGSYLEKRGNIFSCAGWVCFTDTMVALLAGLAIFPAIFSTGLKPDEGPGLVFITIPNIFSKIPLGQFFGTLFFILLILAALTSTISLLEVVTAFTIDELKWSRKKGAIIATSLCFILGVPSALSTGAVKTLGAIYKMGGKEQGFLDLMDLIFGNISLLIGGFFISLFAGWVWNRAEIFKELIESKTGQNYFLKVWYLLLKYVCPIVIFIIFANVLISTIL